MALEMKTKKNEDEALTVWLAPPDRCPATALDMDGFSATQRILVIFAAKCARRDSVDGVEYHTFCSVKAVLQSQLNFGPWR